MTSTSMTVGAGRPPCGLAYLFTSATAAEVVSSTDGVAVLQRGIHPLVVNAELSAPTAAPQSCPPAATRRRPRRSPVPAGPGCATRSPLVAVRRNSSASDKHPPIELVPRQGLRVTRPEHSTVHEGEGRGVSLGGRLVAQQGRKRHGGVRHEWMTSSHFSVCSSGVQPPGSQGFEIERKRAPGVRLQRIADRTCARTPPTRGAWSLSKFISCVTVLQNQRRPIEPFGPAGRPPVTLLTFDRCRRLLVTLGRLPGQIPASVCV